MKTPEQRARDMLERMGVPDAQTYTAGAVVELANLIAEMDAVENWAAAGENLLAAGSSASVMFALGAWWADRPWRRTPSSSGARTAGGKEEGRRQASAATQGST